MSELKVKVPVTKNDHSLGDEHAPITLVEYGDFECPHCGHAHPIVKGIQRDFGKRLRFVYRHFPLTQIHPHAESAAETSEFAGASGRFWEMHDLLFENQDRLSMSLFLELAAALELPAPALRSALATGEFAPKVRSDFMGGVRSGVNGTPTFFVNGNRYDGPVDLLKEVLEEVDRESATTEPRRN
jgi:protein-disulfide isomerase